MRSIGAWILGCCIIWSCADRSEALVAEARDKMQKGKPEEALSLLSEAVSINTKNGSAYLIQGAAYYELQEFSQAKAAFEKAGELLANDYRPWFNLGNVHRQQANPEAALKAYEQALAQDSTQSDVWLNKALVETDIQAYNAAFKSFYRAESLSPSPEKLVHFYRGKLHFRLEQLPEASDDFERAISIDPEYAEGYHALALCRILQEGEASAETCSYLQQSVSLGFAPAQELLDTYCKPKPESP